MKINKGKKRKIISDKGFTLVEVMVALVILAIGLLSIAAMQIAAIKGSSSAVGTSMAVKFAESQLEELKGAHFANDPRLRDVNNDGENGMNNPTRVAILNNGNTLIPAGAGAADYAQTMEAEAGQGAIQYHVYWNVAAMGNNRKHVRVIVAWNASSSGGTRNMRRVDFDSILMHPTL